VTLDDCSGISHQMGDILNVHDVPPGPYTLEVSSPGLDRPLVRDKDFVKYTGCKVDVRLHEKMEGIRHFRGKLTGFLSEEGEKVLTVEVSGKIYRIPKEMVAKARLEYEFKDR
jgi:ribosome maturation factor RimP